MRASNSPRIPCNNADDITMRVRFKYENQSMKDKERAEDGNIWHEFDFPDGPECEETSIFWNVDPLLNKPSETGSVEPPGMANDSSPTSSLPTRDFDKITLEETETCISRHFRFHPEKLLNDESHDHISPNHLSPLYAKEEEKIEVDLDNNPSIIHHPVRCEGGEQQASVSQIRRHLQTDDPESHLLEGTVAEYTRGKSEKKEELRWSYTDYRSRDYNFNNDGGDNIRSKISSSDTTSATIELRTPPSSSRIPSSPKRKLLAEESCSKNLPSDQNMDSPKKKRRNCSVELIAEISPFSSTIALPVVSRGSCRKPKSNSAAFRAKVSLANSTASGTTKRIAVVVSRSSFCDVVKREEQKLHFIGKNEAAILHPVRKMSYRPSSFSPKKCNRLSLREADEECGLKLTASFSSSPRLPPKQNQLECWPKTSNANNWELSKFRRRSQRRVAQAAREKVRKILCSEDDKLEKFPSDEEENEFLGDETISIDSTSSNVSSLVLARKKPSVNNFGFIVLTKETLRKKGIVRGGFGRAFECQYCHKVCTQRSNIIAHVRVHTGEKPFKCVKCYKAFSQKSNLKRHIKTHNLLYRELYNH